MLTTITSQYDKRGYLASEVHRHWQGLRGHRFRPRAWMERIIAQEKQCQGETDQRLRARLDQWREDLKRRKVTRDEIAVDALALLREAAGRTLGLTPYPVQTMGAAILTQGAVAEMATGEGKTLVTAVAAAFLALGGHGAHVATANAYLARRDFEFASPFFDYLGLSAGCLPEKHDVAEKLRAYRADITYGVAYEFGFDYLRDQLVLLRRPEARRVDRLRHCLQGGLSGNSGLLQRGLAFAIIDEIDSVLIDEAASPLLLSEASGVGDSGEGPILAALRMVRDLRPERDYWLDPKGRSLRLTEEGLARTHSSHAVPWRDLRRPWSDYVANALRAEWLFHRDAHYVVKEGAVVIVDEFTGRPHEERKWRDGLHQAVEAKEGLEIQPESETAASITRQRHFRRYPFLCGLTGTASEAAGEFWHFFKLPVLSVPPNQPCVRDTLPDRVFQTAEARDHAAVEDLLRRHQAGQPVLVGTRTIRASESFADLLKTRGIPHRLLTAKQDQEESAIVAGAGDAGAVVIATNMAGRGTHISLDHRSRQAGGLHVLGLERNDSIRIDRQLVGRGARQGQPGSTQFFLSGEDRLMEEAGEAPRRSLAKWGPDRNGELPGKAVGIFVAAQKAVELARYEMRLAMAENDRWMDRMRESLA